MSLKRQEISGSVSRCEDKKCQMQSHASEEAAQGGSTRTGQVRFAFGPSTLISDLGEIVPRAVYSLKQLSTPDKMVVLGTSEEWQRQSSLLLQARPSTVRLPLKNRSRHS